MCRLIVSSAPAIFESSESRAARAVYAATILQLLEMFRHSALDPHHHPGGVLTQRPLYKPGFKNGAAETAGAQLELAFNSALSDAFGNEPRDQSLDRLSAYFQTYSSAFDKAEGGSAPATQEEARNFLSKLADAIAT
jgi:hypothetical protein